MERTQYEIAIEKEAFIRWIAMQEEPYTSGHSRAKSMMAHAIREELTTKQREYMSFYYGGMKMTTIAATYGVDKSTVSRVIANGKRRLRRVLKYCGPDLLRAAMGGQP